MITVRDLARKLTAYAAQSPNTEIMIQYDGDIAFPFSHGTDETAMGLGGMEKFLVLRADQKGKKLVLMGSI